MSKNNNMPITAILQNKLLQLQEKANTATWNKLDSFLSQIYVLESLIPKVFNAEIKQYDNAKKETIKKDISIVKKMQKNTEWMWHAYRVQRDLNLMEVIEALTYQE